MFQDKNKLNHIHYLAVMILLVIGLVSYDIPFMSLVEEIDIEEAYVDTILKSNNTDFSVGMEDYEQGLYMKEVARRITKTYTNTSYMEALKVVQLVYHYAPKNGLSPELVLAVIATESSFNRKALSHVGAKGYMQVIPKWHQNRLKGRDVFNTEINIEVGTAYLAECINKRGGLRGGLACYNGAISPSKIEAYNVSVRSNMKVASNWLASI